MIALLITFALLTAVSIVSTVVIVARDGYRQVPATSAELVSVWPVQGMPASQR